ncbi:DUF262 domain-containing protein [Streptomyces sp. NPDC008139]|uniref:DUF262 domain-containing protein n=1 Tax=Streptomyces sp. NPDC008139 TaxID=3364814 RepID=UPI0036E1FC73
MANDVVDLQAELDKHRRAVDTDYFDLSIREIVRMVESDEIQVAPSYQRQFRWKEPVQSALIESLLLGLPIPAIFVATNRDGTWDVVDGLQRVCTILRFFAIDVPGSETLKFAKDPLRLGDMSQLSGFSKLAYEDLPVPIRLMLGKRYLRVQVLSDKSDHEVRFELFRRLNAGAVELTAQEVRSCVYRGPFNTLIEDLSVTPEYKALLKLGSKNLNDGTSEEIVLKFFAYLDGLEKFNGKVTAFLNDYMLQRGEETDLAQDRELFLKTVRFLQSVIGGEFKRKGVHTTPLNQFEAVLVGIARIYRAGNEPKVPKTGWELDEELVSASRVGTNSRTMLKKRVLRSEELFS